MKHSIQLLPLALCALPLLPACLVSNETKIEHRGQFVGAETIEQIGTGRSQEYVVALLGEPSRKTQLEDGAEIWRWSYTQVRKTETGVILVLANSRTEETRGAAYVEFRDGLTTRAWRE